LNSRVVTQRLRRVPSGAAADFMIVRLFNDGGVMRSSPVRLLLLMVALPSGTVSAEALPAAPPAETQAVNELHVKKSLERIAGREKQPAGRVFKNVQIPWLRAAPAETFIAIMNEGYSRALG